MTFVPIQTGQGPTSALSIDSVLRQWSAVGLNYELLHGMAAGAKRGNKELDDLLAKSLTQLEVKIGELQAVLGDRPPELGTVTAFQELESHAKDIDELTQLSQALVTRFQEIEAKQQEAAKSAPGGMGEMFIATESSVSGMTRSPTNSPWFKRFMQGCHRRMGDVWCPDRPVTMHKALAAQEELENDWRTFEKDPEGQLKTAITGVLITSGFGGGMRGEEINRLDLGIIRKHWGKAISHPEAPHIPLSMIGRFKQTVGEKKIHSTLGCQIRAGFGVPVVDA
jgi:hypothetical protein